MENINFLGKLSDDCKSIVVSDEHANTRILQRYKNIPLEIEIKQFRKSRSSAQNRYFHGVVCPVIIAFEKNRGADWIKNLTNREALDAIKAYIYQNVLHQRINLIEINGREVFIQEGKKLSDMNTEEFCSAVDTIRDFYADFGCHIPEPTKNSFITDYE